MSFNKKLFFSSINQNGRTPKKVYDELNKEFNFDFDPCPKDPDFDGLTISWSSCNFINPPFKEQRLWIKKAYEESLKNKICVMLLPSRTDTRIFHDIILPYAYQIRFIKGRLKFQQYKNSAPFPSMIVIFKKKKIVYNSEISFNFIDNVERSALVRLSPFLSLPFSSR